MKTTGFSKGWVKRREKPNNKQVLQYKILYAYRDFINHKHQPVSVCVFVYACLSDLCGHKFA